MLFQEPNARFRRGYHNGIMGTKKTITTWDIYTMERAGGGPLVHVPRGSA
jgi:hypothetical protein